MQHFRYQIVHVPGKTNIADPLSRLPKELKCRTFDKGAETALSAIVEVNKPAAITMDEIMLYSREDAELQSVKKALHDDQWQGDLKRYAVFKGELCFANEVLLRGSRIVIPLKLRETVLKLAHIGHPGREKMKRRMRIAVWWPGMDGDAEKACRECFECQLVAPFEKPEPMCIRDLPVAPWVHLAGDFLGPLPDNSYLFVLIDLYSRYVLAEPMTRTTSGDVIRFLKSIFTRMGLPLVLTFDNARNFASQEMKDYCFDNGIKLTHTTPYYPSANGEVERQNRSILKVLKISKQQNADWKAGLQEYLYMYSVTPHSVTGVAPAELMFGRRFRDLIPHFPLQALDDSELRDRDRTVKYQAKTYRDEKVGAKESLVSLGDEVLMKNVLPQNKLASKFLPTPAKVIDRRGNSVTLETQDGQTYKRNTSHVKRLVRPPTMDNDIEPESTSSAPRDDENTPATAEKDFVFQPVRSARPNRQITRPKRYDDYHLD